MVTARYYGKILVLGNLREQKSRVALVSIVCYRSIRASRDSRASKLEMCDKARCRRCANRFVIENERTVGCEIHEIQFASIMESAKMRTCVRAERKLLSNSRYSQLLAELRNAVKTRGVRPDVKSGLTSPASPPPCFFLRLLNGTLVSFLVGSSYSSACMPNVFFFCVYLQVPLSRIIKNGFMLSRKREHLRCM